MVSGVSFRGSSLDSARDILNKPQAQQKPQAGPSQQAPATDAFVKPKKKHTALKVIGGLVTTAAVVIAGLVAGHKLGGFEKIATAAAKDGAGTIAKWTDKAVKGMKLDKAGETLTKWGEAGIKAVKGMFGKGAEMAEDIGEAVA